MTRDNQDFYELVLGCESWQEAQRLTDELLKNELVKTVEQLEHRSRQWWRQPLSQKYQIKLIVQVLEKDAVAVKREISRLRRKTAHPPYTIPLGRLSHEVAAWVHRATEIKSATLKR